MTIIKNCHLDTSNFNLKHHKEQNSFQPSWSRIKQYSQILQKKFSLVEIGVKLLQRQHPCSENSTRQTRIKPLNQEMHQFRQTLFSYLSK